MAKLILKSPYLKCGGSGTVSGYMRYIATRENVQIVADARPATKRQEQLIAKLLRDFPDTKELFEYEDWSAAPTKAHASAFITAALELNWDAASRSDVYMKYIATRPRAERLGSHGLFGDSDTVDLDKAMAELGVYTGNVWTHIISLRREDAARLGYDSAGAWRNLLRAHRNEIAAAMHILPENFRWHAAFHDEGEHPHVHMMAWSSDPKQGYLNQDGIRAMRSKLTNDIFKQEMLHLYEQKSASRDELAREARQALLELAERMRQGICDHPEAEQLISELAQKLGTVGGKKQYGYLPKPMKALVDSIVDQMERLPVVADCYEKWLTLQGQVQGYYTGEAPKRLKLSQQKEFRAIKNAAIKEAERVRLGEITFEDAEPDIEPAGEALAAGYYCRMKEIILDESASLEERDYAVSEMAKLAEAGNCYAQHLLGKLYRDGGLLVTDWVNARYWFAQAAQSGLTVSQYALGKLYLSDDTEIRDPAAGLRWLETAFQNGSHYAGYRLGKEYLRGEITAKDVPKALDFMRRSAEMGNQYAQYMLGKLYLMGKEVRQDREQARYWLTRSADQGNDYAQFFLDRLNDFRSPPLMLAVSRLLHHMGNIFRDNSLPRKSPVGMSIDKKRRMKRREKKQALGQKDEPTQEQGISFMGY
jgi:TPR repeat protein